MLLLPAAESKLALHPHSRHGLHNTAYESKIARLCQPVGRPGWGGRGEKKKRNFLAEQPPCTHSSLAPSHRGREERSSEGESLGEAKGPVLLQD